MNADINVDAIISFLNDIIINDVHTNADNKFI